MRTDFSPTRQDVERYRRLRAVSLGLSERLVKTIPPQAFEDIGEALGILHNGTLVLDSQDESVVVADCCLYDWYVDGENLIQRYIKTHPPAPGTDESVLFDAYLQAKYRVLVPHSTVPGAGLYCEDVLNGGELFLMDVAFSQTLKGGRIALAARTVPLGEYWISTGAALPTPSGKALRNVLREIAGKRTPTASGVALAMVRACLLSGSADHVVYRTPKVRPPMPRFPGFKRRRH